MIEEFFQCEKNEKTVVETATVFDRLFVIANNQ